MTSSSSARTFQNGSICRVKVENFMSYTSCEFKPGPGLNLLIGPNGSGKSAIVCALFIGLGGDCKDLGREKNIGYFVRKGQTKAEIEVELFNVPPPPQSIIDSKTVNVVIKTIISASEDSANGRGKLAYFVNGNHIAAAALKAYLETEVNIRTDQLTQFLPQDRVGEFSSYKAVDLLRATESTILGKQMEETHDKLIATKREYIILKKRVRADELVVEKFAVDISKMKDALEKLENREEFLRKIDLMEKKLAWADFDEERKKALEKKELCDKKKEAYENEKKKLEPLKLECDKKLQMVKEKEELAAKEKQKLDVLLNNSNRTLSSINSDFDLKLFEYTEQLLNIETRQQKIEANLAKKESEFTQLEDQMRNTKNLAAIKQEINRFKESYEANRSDIRDLMEQRSSIDHSIRLVRQSSGPIEAHISELSNVENRKRDRLFLLQDRDKVLSAYDWVKGPAKEKFRDTVYGPILLELKSFYNDFVAMCLETVIRPNGFGFFVVKNGQDRQVFRQGPEAGVINPEFSEYDPNNESQRIFNKNTLDSVGILGSLDMLIDCNWEVKASLVANYRLNSIFIGTDKTDIAAASDDAFFEKLKQDAQSRRKPFDRVTLITPKFRFDIVVSKYGNRDLSISTSPFEFRPKGMNNASLLLSKRQGNSRSSSSSSDDVDIDPEVEIERLKAQLHEKQEQIKTHEGNIRNVARQIEELQAKSSETQKRISNLEAESTEIRKSEVKREKLLNEIKTLKSEVNKDWVVEKRNIQTKMSRIIKEKADTTKNATILALNINNALKNWRMSKFDAINATLDESAAKAIFKRSNDSISTFKNQYETLAKEYATAKELAQKKHEIAKRKCENSEEMRKKWENLPKTVEELRLAIVRSQEMADAIDHDPSLRDKHKEILQKSQTLKKQLDENKERLKELKENLDSLKTSWKIPVKNMVTSINTSFKTHIAAIQEHGYKCDGKIELSIPPIPPKTDAAQPNPLSSSSSSSSSSFEEEEDIDEDGDFSGYGIAIKVKFREHQELKQLDPKSHSGGERSLSTFLYLLSLQDCEGNVCPFRIVDEINQGMDEDKERLAFYELVKSCAKFGEKLPQYFLVTPKLLTGLWFHEE